jgi:hypothetical protein
VFQDGSVEAFFAKSPEGALRPSSSELRMLPPSRAESSCARFQERDLILHFTEQKQQCANWSKGKPYEVLFPQKATQSHILLSKIISLLPLFFSTISSLLTLFSKFFSSFLRSTCLLSVSHKYLALEEVYLPIRAAIPNNPTLGALRYVRS